jgi:uncharacterized protein YcfJ
LLRLLLLGVVGELFGCCSVVVQFRRTRVSLPVAKGLVADGISCVTGLGPEVLILDGSDAGRTTVNKKVNHMNLMNNNGVTRFRLGGVKTRSVLAFVLVLCPAAASWAGAPLSGTQILEVPVIASYPIYQTVVRQVPRQQCHIEQVAHRSAQHRSATPAILGTIIGGALGNAVGSKKSNQRVGAVVGGVLGYSIGKDIGRRSQQHPVDHGYSEHEVCSTVYDEIEEERLNGFDVSYAYAGQTYKTRMNRDPGETLRVRVQVQPL